ncbi:MAG: hypothetical protein Q4B69_00030, partial [Slackia sp.]|nr:hypothetical protein [Slackia sp.]
MSIDTRVFAGFTIYAALSCAIGNDLAADYIRSLHQIPTKESVFFFATAAPMGILPIPQTLFAPATLILAILIDAADDSPLCRIRYRTTLLLTAKRFCTIALLSFGSTFLYLMIEA